jgi:hypothetical protein
MNLSGKEIDGMDRRYDQPSTELRVSGSGKDGFPHSA